MLQRIAMTAAPADAVDLLLECHVRIRAFLATARRLGEAGDAEAALVAETARQVHRYFTHALPLHAADEEESILPRLRGREPELDAALEVMARQHQEHRPPLQVLVSACASLAGDPGRCAQLGPTIAAATTELERHFADHLAREEAVIFPAMRRLLDREADAAITTELRRRRQAAGPA
jgi:iron-sulfur cluster repair protein YtfE (RIC family)